MLRGKCLFECRKCGKTFLALDFEYCATTLSCLVPCPDCKTLCAPLSCSNLYRKLGIIPND